MQTMSIFHALVLDIILFYADTDTRIIIGYIWCILLFPFALYVVEQTRKRSANRAFPVCM